MEMGIEKFLKKKKKREEKSGNSWNGFVVEEKKRRGEEKSGTEGEEKVLLWESRVACGHMELPLDNVCLLTHEVSSLFSFLKKTILLSTKFFLFFSKPTKSFFS